MSIDKYLNKIKKEKVYLEIEKKSIDKNLNLNREEK